MNEIVKLGAKAFMDSKNSGDAGSNLDIGTITSALSELFGGEGGFDISSLTGLLQGGGMGDMLQSWMGSGDNQEISTDQISNLLGSDKISSFASKLGLSEDDALGGLQDAVPKMLENASSAGALLDSVGGLGGAMSFAKNLFGK